MHNTRNKTRNHANHIREYQSQLWKDFSSLRTLQRSLIQTATLHKHLQITISMPDIHNSTRRDDTEEQDQEQGVLGDGVDVWAPLIP